MATLKPQSNGPLSTNTVIGNIQHWPLTGGLLHLVQRGGARAGCAPAQSLLAVPNVSAPHQPPVYHFILFHVVKVR